MPEIEVNGTTLNFETEGPEGAPAVVLSNSLSTDLRMWQPQVSALASRYRVVRYDTRGHGKSAVTQAPYSVELLADDLAGLIEALELGPAHVVGLSLGGMTAQVLAMRRPELAASLCLVATTCRPPFGTQAAWGARAEEVRRTGDYRDVEGPMIERWLTRRFRRADPAGTALVREMIRTTPVEGYVGACMAIGGLDACGKLARYSGPVCVIAGEEDPGTTVEDAQLIVAGIAQAELHVMPHARHLLNWDAREVFTPLLLEWLSRAAPSASMQGDAIPVVM